MQSPGELVGLQQGWITAPRRRDGPVRPLLCRGASLSVGVNRHRAARGTEQQPCQCMGRKSQEGGEGEALAARVSSQIMGSSVNAATKLVAREGETDRKDGEGEVFHHKGY